MPTYEYFCRECGEFELAQKMTDKPIRECPKCGKCVERLISTTSFRLIGSGWFRDGYASKPSTSKA